MLKQAITALALAGLTSVPAAAQIGSGANTNNYGYPNGDGGYRDGDGDQRRGGGYPGGGYPGGGYPGRQQVNCSSRDFQTTRCPADTRGGVTLVRQTSSSACVQGRTWGFDRGGIWVGRGCAGIFVAGRGGYPGGGYPGQGPRVVQCDSRNYQPARCPVDVYNGATLVQDISGSCSRRNWGWDRGGVWVNNGCRGRFRVY